MLGNDVLFSRKRNNHFWLKVKVKMKMKAICSCMFEAC